MKYLKPFLVSFSFFLAAYLIGAFTIEALVSAEKGQNITKSQITNNLINSWWDSPTKYNSTKVLCENLEQIVDVRPSPEEIAFIAVCGVNRSHAEGFFTSLIIRPKYKEAREFLLANYIGKVVDIDNDGISEVVLTSGTSHQGFYNGSVQVVSVNGWDPTIIFERGLEDCSGSSWYRYANGPCQFGKPTTASFDFKDLDGDNILDLVETVEHYVRLKGISNEDAVRLYEKNWWDINLDLESDTYINNYLFKNGRFTPYSSN
ncbi:MAG: hypothetical protein HOI80_06730 [Alphaproteobacteria bacterium]|jgi:hypothetical protein|nr:hypothetical protein [Alphaproteobacteria bacterium]